MEKKYSCAVSATLSVIGGRWKTLILHHLSINEVMRFNQLQKTIGDITQRMLTSQLRELEKDGIVNRKVYAEVPPRVEYNVTEYGKSLFPILQAMCDWGEQHTKRNS